MQNELGNSRVYKTCNAFLIVFLMLATSMAMAQAAAEAGALQTNSAAALQTKAVPAVTAAAPQTNAPPAASAATPAAPASQAPQVVEARASSEQALHLLVGRSLVITSPTRIKRVSLADPNIAEAVVVSPTQVLVNGKKAGGVSVVLWDELGQSQAFEILVSIDLLSLNQKLRELFPTEDVHLTSADDSVVVSGSISSAPVADKILEILKSTGGKVVSMMEVPIEPTVEILLQVRFAEVDRTAINQFGINILSLPGAKNVGTISTQQYGAPQLVQPTNGAQGSAIGVSDLLNIFISRPDINLAATIKALQEENLLQILAEPNLMTVSGKEASFLAGGEFPYPVPQLGAAGSGTIITIQFKEYGVKLNFTPVYAGDGVIHLKVKPEVSSLDYTNAITLQGFLIPAISTRRVESDMELRDGQSFAIAGLMDNTVTNSMQKIPWIGDVPIIGQLFRSHSYNKSKTELMVVVTPRLVKPLQPEQVPHGPQMPVPFLQDLPKETGKK